MPKPLSGFIPLTATLTTICAFVLPAWLVQDRLRGGAPPDISAIAEVALLTVAAGVALAYLGSVRWRDLEKLENAWSVTTRVGRRAMPAERLRASAGWGMTTLYSERVWGRGLDGSAAALRWLTPALALFALAAAAACLALAAIAACDPGLTAGLAIVPVWSDALLLALPALLGPVARAHLPRLPHAGVPSDARINAAQIALVERLTDPRLQAGTAAMSAVDHGLDGVFALADRFGLTASPHDRPPHELAGLSELPPELVDAD